MAEKIAVLMGGRSLEREVSLASGQQVCDALDALGFKVLAFDITDDLVSTLRSERPDAAYIALHGKYGEDGTVQELLEFLGIPYTGPEVIASALSWDKSVAKYVFRDNDVPTPPWLTLTVDAFKEMGAATAIDLMGKAAGGFPVAVKPSRQGSALGLHKVDDEKGLADALLDALSYDTAVIVEKWIEGTEVAVTVLGEGKEAQVLPAVEVVPKQGIYDFAARMDADAVEYFAPARLEDEVAEKCAQIALKVHELIGARDLSRVDMVVGADGTPYVLECANSPGMTERSLVPTAAKAAGMDFQDVVSRVIHAALSRRGT